MSTSRIPTAGRVHVVVLLVTLCLMWMLWSGHYNVLLVFGSVCCLLVVWLSMRMKIVDDEGQPVVRLGLRVLAYLPWLLLQIVKANIDVARRILSPSLPISPRLIEVEASQETELGNVIYANSITLTPGTVSIRIREGVVLVHALTNEAAAELIAGEMDRRVSAVERGGRD